LKQKAKQEKNPIIKAFISCHKKFKGDSGTKMAVLSIYKIVEQAMDERAQLDLISETKTLDQTFSQFLLEQLIMQYGIKTLAIKHAYYLMCGLKKVIK
jgi:hypothetical protein